MAALEGSWLHERFDLGMAPAVTSRGLAGPVLCRDGAFTEGRAHGDEGLQMAEGEAHPDSLMLAAWDRSGGPLPRGFVQGAPAPRTGLGLVHEADLPGWFPMVATVLGAAYTLAGRGADALPLLTQALERSLGTRQSVVSSLVSRHWAKHSC